MEIKNKDVLDLMRVLDELFSKECNAKFAYAIIKNRNKASSLIRELRKKTALTPKEHNRYNEYQELIGKEGADKEQLDKDFSDVVDVINNYNKKLEDFLNKTYDGELYKVSPEFLPDKITPNQLELIDKFMIDDRS